MPYWVQGIISFLSIMILLRIAGKKTLGQMTPEGVVIMVALGTLLVHPLKSTNTVISIYGGILLILGLIGVYFIEYYFPKTKSFIMGEPYILIRDGRILEANLKKARMTQDELKMRLRIRSVNEISIIKIAILEISGDISIELRNEYKNPTREEIDEIRKTLDLLCAQFEICREHVNRECSPCDNLFSQTEKLQDKDPFH